MWCRTNPFAHFVPLFIFFFFILHTGQSCVSFQSHIVQMRVKRRTVLFITYRDCGELLSAPIAQQTEEEQQRVDAHPVPAWQYSLQITHGPKFSL